MPGNIAMNISELNSKKQSVDRWTVYTIPTTTRHDSIGAVVSKITNPSHVWDEIDSIFVVDKHKKPIGYIKIETLVNSRPGQKVEEVMDAPAKSVSLHDDQEKAAILSIDQKLESVPVVDRQGRLIGAVPAKNILAILQLENVEDSLRSAGIHVDRGITEITTASSYKLIRYRLPWLILGLAGGFIATIVVGFFEEILNQRIELAFFIPIIVYMSDAVGTQTETLFIRGIALRSIKMGPYMLREALVGFGLGSICGFLLFLFSYVWLGSVTMAIIAGTAMLISTSSAVFIAIFIPWLIARTNQDPAFGSGPFATILQDILSIFIYFVIATALLAKL